MAAAKEKTAVEFDSWKCKHYFEFIWSESKNVESGYEQETKAPVTLSFIFKLKQLIID